MSQRNPLLTEVVYSVGTCDDLVCENQHDSFQQTEYDCMNDSAWPSGGIELIFPHGRPSLTGN